MIQIFFVLDMFFLNVYFIHIFNIKKENLYWNSNQLFSDG